MSRPADTHGDWVLWRRQSIGGGALFLEPHLAAVLDRELIDLEELRRAALREEIEADQRARQVTAESADGVAPAKPATTEATRIGPHRAHEHEVHQHLVLPRVDQVVERMRKLENGYYGEREHTARELKVLGKALDRGAKRSVVRRPDWRSSLENLATEMPAFRAAVDVVTNAFALSEATHAPPAFPPLLLVGPPGVGKSYFCRRLAEELDSGQGWLSLDQPSAGCTLRGLDAHWSTSRHGLLFELLALGATANPLVVLDEIDKATRSMGSQDIDMLSQLYAALEPETAQHLQDVSLDVELDASQVIYVATANQLQALDAALLSRFEVIQVGLPSQEERVESTQWIVELTLARMGVRTLVRVNGGAVVLLAGYSPRVVRRAIEKTAAWAIGKGCDRITAEDVEAALGLIPQPIATPASGLH
jgi:ATP-dependent Lon protease